MRVSQQYVKALFFSVVIDNVILVKPLAFGRIKSEFESLFDAMNGVSESMNKLIEKVYEEKVLTTTMLIKEDSNRSYGNQYIKRKWR